MDPAGTLKIATMEDAIERLYDLSVGTIGSGAQRHERPHKPLLLLVVFDLIATGSAKPERVDWSNSLRDQFSQYFDRVRGLNDSDTPENPFLYLRTDGFWEPVLVGNDKVEPLDRTPTVADAVAKRVSARISNGMEAFVQTLSQRLQLREALISRYFPNCRDALIPLFQDDPKKITANRPEKHEDEEGVTTGRNPAFRKKILEVYDWQCAACGLRIKLPDSQLTFVDGAHLIPFGISRNDHPTNGIALCKNHHWAMDRFLIVPSPEGLWKVSPRLDHRRSLGEKELCTLNNQPILRPHDDAFRPAQEGLSWRLERLFLE